GSVRARGSEVRRDRRPAGRVLPLPEEPAPAGRLHRRAQRAGARVQRGRQGGHARPRRELPGAQVLRRELPRRRAEHHEAPSKAGVQGRDERVLRVGPVQRQVRVHAQRDAVRQPTPVPVLGPAAPHARRLQDRRRRHLQRLAPLRRADELQAAGRRRPVLAS
ncbi:GSDL-motif protein lipase, partial [Zea mays]